VATLCIFLAVYLLYSLRIVKVTSRFATAVMAATGGFVLLYLVVWLLSLLGVDFRFLYAPTPLGIGIRGTISMAPQGGRGSSPQPNDPCHLEGVQGSARGAQASLGPAYHLTAHSPHLQARYHGPDSCTNKRGSRT
jgi:hypothetical protein